MDIKQINSDYLIVKSNLLITANYDLSTQEQRLILILSSLVKLEDKEFNKYEFKIKEFVNILGLKNKNVYKEVSNITKGLMKKVFEIKNPDNKKVLQLAWLSSAEYELGTGIVKLQFSPDLKPYLLELKSLYTKYKLKNILSLKSKYSIRTYEILKCNAFKKEVIIEIDELKKILKTTSYKNYSDFKKRVIEISKRELAKYTDIEFEYNEIKLGRKVVAITFKIIENIKEDIIKIDEYNSIEEYDDDIYIDIRNKINKITNCNIGLPKVIDLVKAKGSEIVYKYIDNYKKFKINKHNPVGFLIDAITKEYDIPKEEINNYQQKPIQSTNFEQRVYDEDYFDSLYDNLRKE